ARTTGASAWTRRQQIDPRGDGLLVEFAFLVLVGFLEKRRRGHDELVKRHFPILVLVGALEDGAGEERTRSETTRPARPATRSARTTGTSAARRPKVWRRRKETIESRGERPLVEF